jgi:endonuclease-3
MPRKSPRARRNDTAKTRLPGKRRPQSTPRSGRVKPSARRALRPAGARHAPQGARPRAAAARAAPAKVARTRRSRAVRASRFRPPDAERVGVVLGLLDRLYPEAHTALTFGNPLQLLIATILSAQCTDARVNQVTPGLFARYPDARAFAAAKREDLEEMIRSTGFFRNKAKAIQSCCRDLVERHGGEVPQTIEELTALPGVGRKTANVVLGNAFGIPGLVVDTHVSRVSKRLSFTDQVDAVRIEHALMPIVPRERWTVFSHWLILHGRRVCVARRPRCSICPLAPHCPRVGVTAAA